jgi:hypothetical protein
MKTNWLLLIAVCLQSLFYNIVAQELSILTTKNVQWEFTTADPGGVYSHHQYPIRDTSINDTSFVVFQSDTREEYSDIDWCPDIIHESQFYMRIDSGKIYTRRFHSSKECLVFNSEWQIGDTIVMPRFQDLGHYIVTAIDTVEIGGINRRKWKFLCPSQSSFPTSFIEGIGGEYRLAEPVFSIYWEASSTLDCFKQDGIHLYGPHCGSCTTSIEDEINNQIEIFPNPTNDFIHIKIPMTIVENAQLEISNMKGECVHSSQLSKRYDKIPIEDLSSGIYIINLVGSNFQFNEIILINK